MASEPLLYRIFGIAIFVLILAGIFGWGANIVELVTAYEGMTTGEVIIRIVGIPIAFIGAIMGYC